MRVSVILPTAGFGTRMNSRKQFLELDGDPIFLYTLRKFAASDRVTEIVVAVRPEDRAFVEETIAGAGIAKTVRVVEGGDTRQQSVENGLAAVDAEAELIAVHDAVRPFVDHETIARVIDEAAETGAAIVGVVPVDTIKRVTKGTAKIRSTVPREDLVMAQTPQVVRHELLKRAYAKATADGFTGTDEASLIEHLEGIEVSVVAGNERNIKITRPSDLVLAQFYAGLERDA